MKIRLFGRDGKFLGRTEASVPPDERLRWFDEKEWRDRKLQSPFSSDPREVPPKMEEGPNIPWLAAPLRRRLGREACRGLRRSPRRARVVLARLQALLEGEGVYGAAISMRTS